MTQQKIIIDIAGIYEAADFRPHDAIELQGLRGLCGTECMCDEQARSTISAAIRDYGAEGVHWIGGGDYHYLSLLWMQKIREPFALMLLDHHSDDRRTAFGGILSCGGWVLEARESLQMLREDSLCSIPVGDLPIYLSIDLDVLSRDELVTNWDQGQMSMSELEQMISQAALSHRIIGIDICGGTSELGLDLRLNRACYERLESFIDSII